MMTIFFSNDSQSAILDFIFCEICHALSLWESLHFILYSWSEQGLSQEMIKGSPNLLIVGPGRGLGSSHNAIW